MLFLLHCLAGYHACTLLLAVIIHTNTPQRKKIQKLARTSGLLLHYFYFSINVDDLKLQAEDTVWMDAKPRRVR